MHEFIKRNRKLLEFYCLAARIIGWALLLTIPVMIAVALLWNQLGGREGPWPPPEIFPTHVLSPMLGLVVLGIGQFIRHLFETETKPGWILRHAEKILYVYAAVNILLAGYAVRITYIDIAWREFPMKLAISRGFLSLVWPLAQALLLVSLAQIVRRIMPVIDESKTLV